MNWKPLVSQEDLLEIIESSKNRPQVIFKHSTSCSISSMAKMRLEDKWDLTGVDAHYLDLLSYRNISNQIAERLSVHHESPQLILLIDGECVYDASHFDITVEELKESLAYARR
jgi:bacillithiol system protein YtxJ